ncbi:MAG TPA: site-specific integrase [Cytophagaceae bacterium]|jgi:integrase|nr:site-specific integrase [Cytophagaceae bacterium]
MKLNSKPTAEVLLYKSKKLADGKHPICLRVTYQRQPKYYSLKESATPEEWIQINSLKPKKEYKKTNLTILAATQKANRLLQKYDLDDSIFSFDIFEREFFDEKPKSVFRLLEIIQEDLLKEERFGSYKAYRDLYRMLLFYKKNKDLFFHEITSDFLEDFEKFLVIGVPPKKEGSKPKGNGPTSIGIYMRHLRAVYNRAIKSKLASQENYPFASYRIRTGVPNKRAMQKDVILKIYKYNPEPYTNRWYAKNYFLFAYLSQGMNFVDIANLKWSNIISGRINYVRQKTERTNKELKTFSINITKEIESILNLFKPETINKDQYIFPIIDPTLSGFALYNYIKNKNGNYNKTLHKIAKELKIEFNLTSYVARHTYATVLKRSNIPTAVISESLGHSSESVTQNYLDSFDNSVIDDANKNLLS